MRFLAHLEDGGGSMEIETDAPTTAEAVRRLLRVCGQEGWRFTEPTLSITVAPAREERNDPKKPWWRPW